MPTGLGSRPTFSCSHPTCLLLCHIIDVSSVTEAPNPEHDLHQQRRVVDAFLTAARDGDFERLVAVLDPEIVLRADGGALAGASRIVRGAQAVAAQASTFSRLGLSNQFVLVNGNIGL